MKGLLLGCGVIVGIVVLVLVVFGLSWMGAYNSLNAANQGQQALWGDIESTLQRRHDLIPNLVATVKGYATHEADVLKSVTEARSRVGQVNMKLANTDPAEMAKFQKAESEFSGALSRLLVVAENYPQLKADANFRDLQSQLEGTENRINVARERYNGNTNPPQGAKVYNTLCGSAFTGLVARIHGFKPAEYFKAEEGAKEAPTVKF